MKNIFTKYNIIIKIFIVCISIICLILYLLNLISNKENINFEIWNLFIKYKILLIYLIIINLITFITFALDKYKSIKKKWRIKISTLINLCFIGGSIGGILAMYLFHHKTKQICFTLGIPLIILTQLIILIYIINVI